MKKFKYALVNSDKGMDNIIETFNNLEEIREYFNDHETESEYDVIKVINENEAPHPANIIWYSSLFWKWNHLKDESERGNISQSEFDNSYREIIQEEKEYIKGLRKTESDGSNNVFNPEKYMNDDEDYP